MSNKLVKCKSCGKEISTEAKTCPQCGAPNKKKFGCLPIVGIAFVALLIIGAIGGSIKGNDGSAATATSAPTAMTKDQWKETVGTENNGREKGIINSGQVIISAQHLFQLVGQPSSSRASGEDTYLFWACSDGTIELDAPTALYRSAGMVQASLIE